MKPQRTIAYRFLLIGGLVLLGLLFTQFISNPAPEATRTLSPEKVNLALRRTAHHLFRAVGDSTSRIPAVQQLNPRTFRLRLDHGFNYDQLPGLLQTSFRAHQITGAYDVAVLDCATGKLQLGYNVSDLTDNESVACSGRAIAAGCYILQVTFANPPGSAPTENPSTNWSVLAIGSLLIGLMLFIWRQPKQPNESPTVPNDTPPTLLLTIGRCTFDVRNQLLTCGSQQHQLTYREAKLLHLLANHPNQVLEREQILKSVWEDEGVIVGRSVDVFMSRLRKLLQDDPTVRIAAVHGVGYRLEVI